MGKFIISKKKKFLFALVLIVVVSYLGATQIFFKVKKVVVSSREIALTSADFFENLRSPSTSAPLGSIKCDEEQGCNSATEAELPEVAWRLYAFSGLIQNGIQPVKVQEYLKKDAAFLTSLDDPYGPDGMLAQILSIYDVTQDSEFLGRAVRSALSFLARYNVSIHTTTIDNSSKFIEKLKISHRMLPVSYNWGLIKVSNRLEADNGADLLKMAMNAKVPLETDFSARELAKSMKDLAIIIDQSVLSTAEVEPNEYNMIPDEGISSSACWDVLNNALFYKAFGDENRLNRVKDFFSDTKIAELPTVKVRVANHQQILPCLQAIVELGGPASGLDREYKALMSHFVIPGLDHFQRKICDGSGAILSFRSFGDTSFVCDQNAVLASDMGWITYLLAGRDDHFVLE